ncbi:MAG: 2OG-Fe(II) oxygenase [Chloroflexota bacterium]|nr:2OG-Fe(II) oxygenase [Chloroflexota bacterium]
MIEISDNFLPQKHLDSLNNLHIEYGKVHWYGESCSPQNSLHTLIASTHYSDQLSGATAWYNIRPKTHMWHNDIDSYCTQNGIQFHPKKFPDYTYIYYMRAPDTGGELEILDTGSKLIECIPNRLVKFPCNMPHRVRPYKGNRVSIGIIWWYDLPEIYGEPSQNSTAVLPRVWEIEDARHCYICKMGWLPDEKTPVLREHEGLWYCEACHHVIAERIRKGAK